MKTGSAILMGCGLALACLLVLGLAVGGFVFYAAQDPKGMRISVHGADTVRTNELLELVVEVVNERAGNTLNVSSIDIGEEYLEGFMVVSTEPPHRSSTHVPIDNSRSYDFDRVVPSGATNVFKFKLRARKAGTFQGDVDVCEGMRYLTMVVETKVE